MMNLLARWLSAPARPRFRPALTPLEDRTTPVTISGNTVTLDDPNEHLVIFAGSTTNRYLLRSSTDGDVTLNAASGLVTVVDSAAGTSVDFGSSSAFTNPFAVTLDDSPGTVVFTKDAYFGSNSLTVTTTRNIVVNVSVQVTTTSGDITLSANQQATPTDGDFVGVDVRTSLVSSGSGTVRLSGRGGTAAGGNQIGVRALVASGLPCGIRTTGSGSVFVTGTGGASTGDFNYGVQVVQSRIVSGTESAVGGNVTVVGTGGGVGGNSNYNIGVFANLGGLIEASNGYGAVTVTGTGGTGGSTGNSGVQVDGAAIRSLGAGGGVTVTGSGGGTALNEATANHGVVVSGGGYIYAIGGAFAGSGTVSVSGRGNTNGLNAGLVGNVGVIVTGANSLITSYRGPISIQGTDGTYRAVVVQEGGSIAATGDATNGTPFGPVTVTTDTLEILGTGTISAGTGTVSIQTLSVSTVVALGGADDTRHYPTSVITPVTLGLTDAELDAVTAGTLVIGNANINAAPINLGAAITRPAATAVRLSSTGNLSASGDGRFDTGGGTLSLNLGGNIVPVPAGYDFTASAVSGSNGTGVEIPFLNSGPTQLTVNGAIKLTGLRLVLSGSTVPAVGDTFVLVAATGPITGTFAGLPNGSYITFNGVNLQLTYTANTVIATDLAGPLPPTSVAPQVVRAVGDTVTMPNPAGGTWTFVPFPGFTVSVASADLNGDGVPDVVVGAGPGGGPHVRVFDGATRGELASFFAYSPQFGGGVDVAATTGRIVTGAGAGGGPHVKVIDAAKMTQTLANGQIADSALVANFFAYDPGFTGGVHVAIADVTGDGIPDVVTGAGAGGGPHVKGIDGTKLNQVQSSGVIADSALFVNLFAFDPAFTGGVYVAATTGQFAVGAGAGGGPHVKVYFPNGNEKYSFFAYDPAFTGGVRVDFADVDGVGSVDLVTATGPGGGPHLKAFALLLTYHVNTRSEILSTFVGDPTDTRGVAV